MLNSNSDREQGGARYVRGKLGMLSKGRGNSAHTVLHFIRSFIEQLVKERKASNTIENYGRDLNDFLSAFPEIPFSE
ncbi:hypothetical protein KSC_068120 [Ktedonobacter sp. SOSP1-52]|nr:hypothetical protein KSC_068120 [Ktedonobacter sp. SOSP1-52]